MVNKVLLRGSAWASGFPSYSGYAIPVGSGAQLAMLPWTNIDQIKIAFSEDAAVGQDDLGLSGVNPAEYAFKPDLPNGAPDDGFVYDPATFTATWTLTEPIGSDRLMLRLDADGSNAIRDAAENRLDGEWTNPVNTSDTTTDTYPSGNGTAGGDFLFRLNILPGDVDQNGAVDIFDVAVLQREYGTTVGATPADGDFDGNGTVDIFDVAVLQRQYGQSLAESEPTINSALDDGGAELSADGLSLFFFSDRPGGKGNYDIWMATRSNVAAFFGTPINLESINTSDLESGPSISADGLTLVFHSTRPGGLGSGDIWMATRATTADPFDAPVNLGPGVNSADYETVPDISADGLTLVFTSWRPEGQGSSDLWMAERLTTADPFLPAVNLGALVNSSEADGGPELSADGLTLYFHSKRAGGLGDYDLWKTTRATKNDAFGAPVHLDAPLNSVYLDGNASVTADGKTLFFNSNRPGGQGMGDIWQWRLDVAGGLLAPASSPLLNAESGVGDVVSAALMPSLLGEEESVAVSLALAQARTASERAEPVGRSRMVDDLVFGSVGKASPSVPWGAKGRRAGSGLSALSVHCHAAVDRLVEARECGRADWDEVVREVARGRG
ncbi:MAG: dockerin type I domain-containing protein [Pirellulales bacterium]